MSGEDWPQEHRPELAELDAEAFLDKLAERDPSFAEGSAIYDLVGKVSSLLRQMRSFAKLTQSELAERLGVTQGRISQIESGLPDHAASLETVARFALACGYTPQIDLDPSISTRDEGLPKIPSLRFAAAPPAAEVARTETKYAGSS
jgi:transcriptional regulator with XRE-family HTH domain